MVHGWSGSPARVASGGGPERSMPKRRRLGIPGLPATPAGLGQLPPELQDRGGRPVDRDRPGLAAAPDLNLDLSGPDGAPADGQAERAAQQPGVGEFLAGGGAALG